MKKLKKNKERERIAKNSTSFSKARPVRRPCHRCRRCFNLSSSQFTDFSLKIRQFVYHADGIFDDPLS